MDPSTYCAIQYNKLNLFYFHCHFSKKRLPFSEYICHINIYSLHQLSGSLWSYGFIHTVLLSSIHFGWFLNQNPLAPVETMMTQNDV